MADRLEVLISGDNKELNQALKNSEKNLKNFDKATKNISGKIGGSLSKGASSMNRFGKSTANAVPAVTEFSRVIQDAPFGIQGVANNITQLTQQFGNLSTKLGGSKAALQAMLGTLTGPAGILLAISAITSLLVAFGDKLFKSADASKVAKREQDKLNESLNNYISTLSQVSQSQLKGEQNSQKEIVTLRLLRNQAEDTTLSLQKRLGAVKELKNQFPDYFKDLSNEKILNGGLESTYDSLTKSIIKRAKATAASNKIIKNSENLLTLQSQLSTKNEEIRKKLIQTENAERLAVLRAGKERTANNFSVENAIKLRKEYNKLLKQSIKIQGQIQSIELENIDLESNIVSDQTGGGIAPAIRKQTPKVVEALSLQRVGLVKGIDKIIEATKLSGEKFKQVYGEKFGNVNGINFVDGILSEEQISVLQDRLIRLNESTQLITQSMSSAFNTLTQSISNSLTQQLGLLGSFLGAFIDFGAKILQAQIKRLISEKALEKKRLLLNKASLTAQVITDKAKAASSAIVAASNTAKAAGPKGAFILPALIAGAVAAVSGAFGKIGGGSSGSDSLSSNVTSGVSGGSSADFGSSSRFTGSSGGFGEVVFRIAGTDLVGVLQNQLEQNRNLGGSVSISSI